MQKPVNANIMRLIPTNAVNINQYGLTKYARAASKDNA